MTAKNETGAERTAWQQKIYDLQVELGVGAEEGLFCCQYFEECSGSVGIGRKGDWAYVGSRYGEASVGGKRARVLFVGIDRPFKGKEGERSFLDYWKTQQEWRNSALNPDPKNLHMVGVKVVLKHLLDGVRAEDRCEQFALVNAVLCGAAAARGVRGPLMTTKSSSMMKRNCREHMKRFLQRLEPDILIAQGKGAPAGVYQLLTSRKAAQWHFASKSDSHKRYRHVDVVAGEIGGRRVWGVLMAHPRFYGLKGLLREGSVSAPEELEKAFELIRDRHAG